VTYLWSHGFAALEERATLSVDGSCHLLFFLTFCLLVKFGL
jgi:hypothetical protein